MSRIDYVGGLMRTELREPIEAAKLYTIRVRDDGAVLSAIRRPGWIEITYTHDYLNRPVEPEDDRKFFFVAWEKGIVTGDCNPCRYWCELREESGASTGWYLFEKVSEHTPSPRLTMAAAADSFRGEKR